MGTHRYRFFLLMGLSTAFILPLLGTFLITGAGLKENLENDAAVKYRPLILSESRYMGEKLKETELLFRHLAREFTGGGSPQRISYLLDNFREAAAALERLEILDLQGNILFSHPDNQTLSEIPRLEDPLTSRAMESGTFEVSSSILSRETGRAAATAALLLDGLLLYGRLNLEYLSESFAETTFPAAHGAELFFTDSKGVMVVHRDFQQVLRRDAFLPFRDLQNQDTGEVKVLMEPVNDNLLLEAPVPHSSWHGILILPAAEILAPLKHFWYLALTASVFGWAAAAVFSLLAAGGLEKSFRSMADGLAALRDGRPLPPAGRSAVKEINDLQGNLSGLGEALQQRDNVFRKQLEELESKKLELNRFTLIMSQDLKGPLITIRGFLGHLQKDWDQQNPQRFQEDVRRIEKATSQMQDLLEDLLHFSRSTETGERFQPFRMHAAFKSGLDRLPQPFPDGCLKFPPEPWPSVYGDYAKIAEVWKTLLENSLKFQGEQPPAVEAGWRQDQDETVFFLKDSGIGIDPAYHEKVFGLFEKLDPGKAGAGIGLALAKRIIALHQGRIWVESKGLHQGATFLFTLPDPSRPSS